MVRARAALVLHDVAHGGASLDAVLDKRGAGLEADDRALFRELSFGALRWFWRCKAIVDQLVRRPIKKRDAIIEAVIVTGLYQLDQMRLPPHAAIHATVQACVTLDRGGFKGLVNGVLRNFQRRRAELLEALSGAARDAHPEWLWRTIHEQWPARADGVIQANNSRPPMILRVNARYHAPVQYLERLRAAGIEAHPLDHAPDAVVLRHPVDVDRLPGFREGRVSIQDASAQLLARVLPADPGERALDACAAPGGKLTHLLERFPGMRVQAVEADPGRAGRIRENLERLGLEAEVTVADASRVEQWWNGLPFDLVLLDAPCSATGVVRRHPDIKVLRRASDPGQMAELQARLLEQLFETVKPGGRLVYVTCSILAEENQDQIEAFLRRTPGARGEPVQLPVGESTGTGWQVLPGDGEGDGFYYAVIRRGG